ncbi:MAG: hypothetical protein V2A74_06465 [bacterium]
MAEKSKESREPEEEFGFPWGVEEYERKMQAEAGKGKSAVPGREQLAARLSFYRYLLYALFGASVVLQVVVPVMWALIVWAPITTRLARDFWLFWPCVYLLLAVGLSKFYKYTYIAVLYFSMAQILIIALRLINWVFAGTGDGWGYLWVAQRLLEWAFFFALAKFLFQSEVREMFKDLEPEI